MKITSEMSLGEHLELLQLCELSSPIEMCEHTYSVQKG